MHPDESSVAVIKDLDKFDESRNLFRKLELREDIFCLSFAMSMKSETFFKEHSDLEISGRKNKEVIYSQMFLCAIC
jgi:hypothetical protein